MGQPPLNQQKVHASQPQTSQIISHRNLCGVCKKGTIAQATEVSQVPSNIRKWRTHLSTVWKCSECSSLISLEKLDMEIFYQDYPFHLRRLDFSTRQMFKPYLKRLEAQGLSSKHSILDYGCGSGIFLKFLEENGYHNIAGYDPYTPTFSNPEILSRSWDWILCQDVLEHVEDPPELMKKLATCLTPDGRFCIGTPRAESIDLKNFESFTHSIHQPFHLHVVSEQGLIQMATSFGLELRVIHQTPPINTLIPFLNWSFAQAYLKALDNCMDSLFEPIKYRVVFRSLRLLALGFFGGLPKTFLESYFGIPVQNPTEMLAIFQRTNSTNSRVKND